MVELDRDAFSSILSYIHEPETLYTILRAFPKSHQLYPAAVDRVWQLPVHLDSYHTHTAAASNAVLDCLLATPPNASQPLASHLRELVVHLEHVELENKYHQRQAGRGGRARGRGAAPVHIPGPPHSVLSLQNRVADLLGAAPNLRSFDYRGYPGLELDATILEPLGQLERLQRFGVDCARCNREHDVPASGGDYAVAGELSALYDAENWDIDAFVANNVGSSLSVLDLRHVNYTMFAALKTKVDDFKTYSRLRDLRIDITEGVWDWGGGGSPAMGATPNFEFHFLGFPAVERFELVVCDKTLSAAQLGPLKMVNSRLLKELRIDVRHSVWWSMIPYIRLFEALPAEELPSLQLLEIKDMVRNTDRHFYDRADNANRWRDHGRDYCNFVSPFLPLLSNLTSLWVDERVLLPPSASLQELFLDPQRVEVVALRAVLSRLTSLRVGFGRMKEADVALVLGLCDPAKLTQFGFEWDWQAYEKDEPLSAVLWEHLRRFSLLADVHILFPRPDAELPKDPHNTTDVARIFELVPSVHAVGIGNSVVWERGLPPPTRRNNADEAAPRFFRAGFMLNESENGAWNSDNVVPARPDLGVAIEQLRDALQNILA